MVILRPAHQRGSVYLGWLDSHHSFSFGHYYDPQHMGFSSLRVINEDKISPSQGFGTHGHQNMEIITYVLSGSLKHQDSLGNGSVLRSGQVQRMTAGTGIFHSEFNASQQEPVHLLQIWIQPNILDLPPSYEEITLDLSQIQGSLHPIASQNPQPGTVKVHQNMELYASILKPGDRVTHTLGDDRSVWIQVARGAVNLTMDAETIPLAAGDGAAIVQGGTLTLEGNPDGDFGEILLFDLPAPAP